MKKPNSFDVMSDQTCSHKGCDKGIKQNVVDRKVNTLHLKCRRHHWINHPTLSNRANR